MGKPLEARQHRFFLEELEPGHKDGCRGQGQQIVDDPVGQCGGEQGIGRRPGNEEDDSRFEDAHAAGDVADEPGHGGQHEDAEESQEGDFDRLRQQQVKRQSGKRRVRETEHELFQAKTDGRDGETEAAITQGSATARGPKEVGHEAEEAENAQSACESQGKRQGGQDGSGFQEQRQADDGGGAQGEGGHR